MACLLTILTMILPVWAMAEETLTPGIWYELRLSDEGILLEAEPATAEDLSVTGESYTGWYRLTDVALLALRPEGSNPFGGAAVAMREQDGWRCYGAAVILRRDVSDERIHGEEIGNISYALKDGVLTQTSPGGYILYDVVDGELIVSETEPWTLSGPMERWGENAFLWSPEGVAYRAVYVCQRVLPEPPEVVVERSGPFLHVTATAHGDGGLVEVALVCMSRENDLERATTFEPGSATVVTRFTVREPGNYAVMARDATGQTTLGGYTFFTDMDGDGLNDDYELMIGTDPDNVDTDGDGVSDYDEIINGTDPLTQEDAP